MYGKKIDLANLNKFLFDFQ